MCAVWLCALVFQRVASYVMFWRQTKVEKYKTSCFLLWFTGQLLLLQQLFPLRSLIYLVLEDRGIMLSGCYISNMPFSGISSNLVYTYVHLDSKMNWLDFGGQRSSSLWPHKTYFWPSLKNSFNNLERIRTTTWMVHRGIQYKPQVWWVILKCLVLPDY